MTNLLWAELALTDGFTLCLADDSQDAVRTSGTAVTELSRVGRSQIPPSQNGSQSRPLSHHVWWLKYRVTETENLVLPGLLPRCSSMTRHSYRGLRTAFSEKL